MRTLILSFILTISHILCYSQSPKGILLSGIIIDPDSVPIPNVSIINTRSTKMVLTDNNGYFQTEIESEDSLFVSHIAYKKIFISKKNNGRYCVMEPQVQELLQVDVIDTKQGEKNLKETVEDIKRLAPLQKLTGYDLKSRQSYFIDQNGSHNKGFSPFFGPTVKVPLEKIIGIFVKSPDKQKLKKMTSHYHRVKKKNWPTPKRIGQ